MEFNDTEILAIIREYATQITRMSFDDGSIGITNSDRLASAMTQADRISLLARHQLHKSEAAQSASAD